MKTTGLLWWIDRWRTSHAWMDMTLEQQGAYRNLLDEAHLQGGKLPADERVLANACGDANAWQRVRGAVLARFVLEPDGWYHTDRLTSPAPAPASSGALIRRPHIPLWIRRFILSRDGVCRLCGGAESLELDHVVRWRDGGRDTIDNLRVLCRPCNRRRG